MLREPFLLPMRALWGRLFLCGARFRLSFDKRTCHSFFCLDILV